MVTLLLDAYNLLFRAFTSLPRAITDESGEPINAVYGMLAYLARLARELSPTSMVAAFDTPEVPTFRHQLFPAYQGHRGPLGGEHAPDFARQVEIARRVLPALDVPSFSLASYEADDVLGTIACAISRDGGASIIVSTDRDLLQLVSPGIETMAPGNPPRVARTEEDVRARLGVPPAGVATFKALAGDASDNIPGVRGIGAKSAAALVNAHASLEALYEHLDSVSPRLRAQLELGRDDAFLFRTIATVVTDLDLGFDTRRVPRPAIGPESKPRALLRDAGYS